MYADDTTIYCNITQNVNEIVINTELEKGNKWMCSDKLSLNIKNTKFMVFHHNQKQVQYPNIKINNIEINRVIPCRPKMEKTYKSYIYENI